jgi:hypothetical protein
MFSLMEMCIELGLPNHRLERDFCYAAAPQKPLKQTFHYLVGTASGVEHFTERNELGLFSVGDMNWAFAAANLIAKYDEPGLTGKGLYIARKKESEPGHAVEPQKQGAR